MIDLGVSLSEWARSCEALLEVSLSKPSPSTVLIVFAGGLLTSLGPCSLSLLPVTLAYLAGFGSQGLENRPWLRSLSFSAGIVVSLVLLGLVSGMLGRIYGQIPGLVPSVVAILALVMGLNLLGLLPLALPTGPDPEQWRRLAPAPVAPLAAGVAFGLAATPCTTPVLAVLLGWMAQTGKPGMGMLMLTSFGAGQVFPLLLAGTAAASLPALLHLRQVSQWVPPLSGAVLITTGVLTLVANWT